MGPTTIDSNFILCIFGREKRTRNFALNIEETKFLADSRVEFQVQDVDVDEVKFSMFVFSFSFKSI